MVLAVVPAIVVVAARAAVVVVVIVVVGGLGRLRRARVGGRILLVGHVVRLCVLREQA